MPKVLPPIKSVIPIYSRETVQEHKRQRARQEEIRTRDAAEREARLEQRAVIQAMADRSTRH